MNNKKIKNYFPGFENNFLIFILLAVLPISGFLAVLPTYPVSAQNIPAGCPGSPTAGPPTPGVDCKAKADIPNDAEAKKRADAYCKTRDFEGVLLTRCSQGYIASIQAKANDRNNFCDNLAATNSHKNACKNGFDQGMREFKKSNTVVISYADSTKKAEAYCKRYDGEKNKDAIEAIKRSCRQGYISALSTTEVNYGKVCDNDKMDGANNLIKKLQKETCEAGFKQGLREYQDLAGINNPATPSNNEKQGEEPGGEGPEGGSLTDCDVTKNPLSWIMCPIIDLGADLSDSMFQNIISPLLSDVPISDNREDPVYKAWQGFRLIANIMLVGSMLAIVYAQTRGGDK